MACYVLTKHDSNANGSSNFPRRVIGAVMSPTFTAAMEFAAKQFNWSETQWCEVDRSDRVSRGTFSAACRSGVYVQCPDCGVVPVVPTTFQTDRVPLSGDCPKCGSTLFFGE